MHVEDRLAAAFGVVNGAALKDDEASRKSLVRAGETMVDAGLAIVVNKAGTKHPMCTLTAIERKRADQEAMNAAAVAGDPNAHRRTHRCGLVHAITDRKTATRVLTRLTKRGLFNLGVEPRASRLLIVDLDTAKQVAEFALRCGQNRPSLTVRSPGSRDGNGTWVHRDGGHIYFDVPPEIELPLDAGMYTDDAGWTAVWGEHQVLVPPSVRAEGAYVLTGGSHPLPVWLRDLITTEALAKQVRREESVRRRESSGPSAIDDWATGTSWDDILEVDGWIKTGLVKNCGCPQWTAPGEHASPESATAHEVGCSVYSCERGHGPLRVWTDNPSEAVAAAIGEFGRTLTKIQVLTHTEGGGRMGRTLTELGIERPDDPAVRHHGCETWSHSPAEPSAIQDETVEDDEEEDDPDDDDPAPEMFSPEQLFERRVRKEYEHELVRRAALERIAADDMPAMRTLRGQSFLRAPRPVALISKMLYRDSLARIYGAPGSGKSFVAMDIALSIAQGKWWGGVRQDAAPVVYVMAEGQAVNADRAEAWVSANGVEELDENFIVVPDAVLLTEYAARDLVALVAREKPVLVVLDTKNAMMLGEENSATDFAVLRRVLDQIRKAADCCVVLVDHTGYEGTRARGSSAGTAAMDTEIRVEKNDESNPPVVTAEVTRDKASEAGANWAWNLVPETPAAVLKALPEGAAADAIVDADKPEWRDADVAGLPAWIEHRTGSNRVYLIELARYMRFETSAHQDPSGHGRTLAQAVSDMKPAAGNKRVVDAWRTGIRRAWSQLKNQGCLEYYDRINGGTDLQERSGAHVWTAPE